MHSKLSAIDLKCTYNLFLSRDFNLKGKNMHRLYYAFDIKGYYIHERLYPFNLKANYIQFTQPPFNLKG